MQSKGPNRNLRTRQNEQRENLNYTYTIVSAVAGLAIGGLVGYFVMDNITSGLMIFCGVGVIIGSFIDYALNKKRKKQSVESKK